MRKLCTFLLTMMVTLLANAFSNPTIKVGDDLGSVADAAQKGVTFAIVNPADNKALFGSGAQNVGYDATEVAYASTAGYVWKLISLADNADEDLKGYYHIHLVANDGADYTFSAWGGNHPGYLNSQPLDGSVSFVLGLSDKMGQDIKNGAVYDIQYVDGKGFTIKNVGTGKYQSDNGVAKSDEPVFWSFKKAEFDYSSAVAEALAEGDTYKALVTNKKALEAYATAAAALSTESTKTADDLKKAQAAVLALIKAQTADGTNFTNVITNPSFELGNTSGWTVTNSNDTGAKENSNATYTMTNCDGKYVFNIWSSGNAISQKIEGMPNGTYKLQAVIATDGGHKVQLNGNDKNVQIDAVDKGTGVEGELEFDVTDGTITIGAEGVDKYWYKVDNFRLTLVKIAVPEQDDWFKGIDFCFRDKASTVATSKERTFAVWGIDPDDPANGCIVATAGKNSSATNAQFWIRGAEYVEPTYIGEDKAQLTAVYDKGGFASGTGFKVTMRVKADGEYSAGSQTHKAFQHKSNDGFGTLNVTKEWQTVSFVCIADDARAGFTDLCFNLAASDADRTFYFDDIQIVRGAQWALDTRITDKWKENGTDQNKPAEYKSDGYVEIVTKSNANTWDNQVFFQIADAAPNGKLKKNDKITLQFKAMAALDAESTFDKTEITAGGGFHKSYDGAGWLPISSQAGSVTIPVGKWSDEITKEITIADDAITNFSLDLSYDSKPITYRFKDVKVTYTQGTEAWTETMAYRLKVTPFTPDPADETKMVKGDDTNEAPAYDFGTGGEEGGYFKVTAAAKQANTYETQFFFQIADLAPSKALKANETVNLKFKIKALATETVPAATELSLGGGFHKSNDGAGWLAGATASKIKVGEWTTIEQKFEIDNPSITSYSIDLSQDDKGSITYLIDEVEGTWTEAPVLDWVELISNGDCEKDPEHVFAASKETPVDGSNVNQSRYVDSGDATHGKVIEIAAGPKESQAWDNQFWIYEPYDLPSGTSIVVEFDYKAEVAAKASTQTHTAPGAYQYWRAINDVNFTTEWQHFKFEGKVTTGDNDATVNLRSVAFNMSEFAEANKYYIDNVSFKVPAGTIDGLEPTYIDDLKKVEYIDPTTIDWSDNILKNGDLKGDDMSEFYLKNNDVEDPETLMAEKTEFGGAFEIDIETAARPAGEKEGEVGGNDHDAQFFVRLPYVLPKGTTFNLEFDLYAEEINTLAIQAHAEPGQYKGNLASVKTDPSLDAVHFQKYLKAPEDMRSIAINLAVATDATYAFSNFKVQIPNDAKAAIEETTATADASTLWAETLALNEAAFEGRNTETEGKGYDEALVKALEDAIAAGKAELKKEDATKESLAAAAKAIEDAIAALTGGAADEYIPLPELAASEYEAIPLSQADYAGFATAAVTTGEYQGNAFTTYTASGQIQGAFKMTNIDVTGCDKIYIYFAKPVAKGWEMAFWGKQEDVKSVEEGATFIELDLSDKFNGNDPATYELDGKTYLNEATILTLWGTETFPLELNVYGVYKHKNAATAINAVEEDAAPADGKYIENGQIVIVKGGKKYTAAGVEIK